MKERNPAMDFQCDLMEDTKAFIDDLYDHQIINISKKEYRPAENMFSPVILTNKHGRSMGFTRMGEVKRYCHWLIEIGAVKLSVGSKDSAISLGINPAH